MEVIYFNKDQLKEFPLGLCLTIGAYDSIHMGHLEIIKKMIEVKGNLQTAVVTFDEHPDYILKKRQNYGVFHTISEKASLFSKLGVDYLIILKTKEIINLSYVSFNEILVKLNTKTIIVGEDFHYGAKGLGSIETLKDTFKLFVIPIKEYNGKKISSEQIREYLNNGEIEKINEISNDKFEITGVITHGKQIGRTIGFRTANIPLNDKYYNLKTGVYEVRVKYKDTIYKGIANIGFNPTINSLSKPRLEVHILGFYKDLYGEEITVTFIRFIREEKKFSSLEDLKEAIQKDISYINTSN